MYSWNASLLSYGVLPVWCSAIMVFCHSGACHSGALPWCSPFCWCPQSHCEPAALRQQILYSTISERYSNAVTISMIPTLIYHELSWRYHRSTHRSIQAIDTGCLVINLYWFMDEILWKYPQQPHYTHIPLRAAGANQALLCALSTVQPTVTVWRVCNVSAAHMGAWSWRQRTLVQNGSGVRWIVCNTWMGPVLVLWC